MVLSYKKIWKQHVNQMPVIRSTITEDTKKPTLDYGGASTNTDSKNVSKTCKPSFPL